MLSHADAFFHSKTIGTVKRLHIPIAFHYLDVDLDTPQRSQPLLNMIE